MCIGASGLYYGECVANDCICKVGYHGRGCSLVPVTSAIFPRTGVPNGGIAVSVRGLFLGGECCSRDPDHAIVPNPLAQNVQKLSKLKIKTSNLVTSASKYDTTDDALIFSSSAYPVGSQISFQVSFDGGSRYIQAPNSFLFQEGPIVTSFNPTTSPLGGDTIITIRGERFYDNMALSCRFGSAGETRALWVTTTMLKCATSPFVTRPARSPSPPTQRAQYDGGDLLSQWDEMSDIMRCASYNSGTCVSLGLGLCMWHQARCVPAYAALTAVTGSQELSVSTNGQDFTPLQGPIHYYDASSAFTVSPTFGGVEGGTRVTVTGPPDFIPSPEALCRFDAKIVATEVTTSSVTCVAPPVTSGRIVPFAVALDGQHFVCVPEGTINRNCTYFYFEKVHVFRLFPSVGATVGGMRVTVTGNGFLSVNTARCRFGTTTVSFDVFNVTSGVCVSPATSAASTLPFAVTINGKDEEVLASGFLYYSMPILSSLNPNGAAVSGGASITVLGTRFQEYADHIVLCRFTPQPDVTTDSIFVVRASQVVSGISVVCVAPAVDASGKYKVQVSLVGTKGGFANDTVNGLRAVGEEWSLSVEFQYFVLPTLAELKPVTGSMIGGTKVSAILTSTIKLFNFARCIFSGHNGNGKVETQATVTSSNIVECLSPPLAQVIDRYPSVQIALNGQDLTSSKSHVFTYVDAPVSSAVSPTMTTTHGGTILLIKGSNFAASYWASCVFRRQSIIRAVPATIVSRAEARCSTPPLPAPGTYEVTVSPSDSFEGTSVSLPVVAGATVTGLSPSHGLVRGGTTVTLNGREFWEHKTPICLFGWRVVVGKRISAEKIVCKSPPSPLQRLFRVPVSLSLDGGVSYFNSTHTYEYYPLLNVTDVNPQVGLIQGGNNITVSLTGLRNVSGITCRFGFTAHAVPSYVGVQKVPAVILSNSDSGEGLVMCTSPPHHHLYNFPPWARQLPFAVSHNGQDEEFALASVVYTFHRPLIGGRMWPSAGPVAGGTLVTLTADQGSRTEWIMGADFVSRNTALPPDPMPASRWVHCRVGADTVRGRLLPDGIECRITACTGANDTVTGRTLQVSLNGQDFASSAEYRFLCTRDAVVDRVVPSRGPAQLGSRVTLYGRHFFATNYSRCTVGNLSSPAIVMNSTVAYCDAMPIEAMNISRQALGFVSAVRRYPGPGGVMGSNLVAFAVDGQYFPRTGLGRYVYYPSVSVHRIDPATASTTDGVVLLTVFGGGFGSWWRNMTNYSATYAAFSVNASSVSAVDYFHRAAECRFGGVVVKATVTSAETLVCASPAATTGSAVLVEVGFNREDFEGHNSVFHLRRAPAPRVANVVGDCEPGFHELHGSNPCIKQGMVFLPALNGLRISWIDDTDRGTFRSSAGAAWCGISSQEPCGAVLHSPLVRSFDCGEIIAAPAGAGAPSITELLGHGAVCRWQDNRTLVVVMGATPALLPGASLRLRPSSVMRGSQHSYYSAPTLPNVTLPDEVLVPVPVIVAPAAVGACEGIQLDGSMSYNHGGRPLNFAWRLVSPTLASSPQTPEILNISTRLAAASGDALASSALEIPSGLLTAQEYTFELNVSNWAGKSAATQVTVKKSSALDMPSVRILSGAALQTRAGLPLDVTALVAPSTCTTGMASSALSIQWAVKERVQAAAGGLSLVDVALPSSIVRTAPRLRLPAHTLGVNRVYSIQAAVSAAGGGAVTAATQVTVVPLNRVVAWISGGDRQVPHDQDLELDASKSLDPDSAGAAALAFAWRCEMRDLATQGVSPCVRSGLTLAFSAAAEAVTAVRLSADSLGATLCYGNTSAAAKSPATDACTPLEFLFTVTVSRAGGSGAANATVRVRLAPSTTAAAVSIQDSPCVSVSGRPRCRVNVGDELLLHGKLSAPSLAADSWVTKWSTISGDVDIGKSEVAANDASSLSLELKPNVLTQGALYKFRLYARRAAAAGAAVSSLQSALTEGGYAEVVVECNAAPSGGRVLVDSFAGQALISNFTLTAAGTSTCACMTRTRTQACPLKDTYVSTCVHVCSQRVI